ncbi:MAG: carboxylate-amine ligase [bacterium]|nr:carboxylate-amine ligase [bacterium]
MPPAGSPAELAAFGQLQSRLAPMYRRVFSDDQAPRTVVVIPSLSLDPIELRKIRGVRHYEERMLCLLMLLRLPNTNVVYVTSRPMHPSIIDYYIHLLPGVPGLHARNRLTLLDCDDESADPLTQKILDRPRLMRRISGAIPDKASAHITCFNATDLERSLAVQLGIPLYACDPELNYLGDKSNGRDLFGRIGIDYPTGAEHLRDEGDVVGALAELRGNDPSLQRSVVKLNESFSGEGNAIFSYGDAPNGSQLVPWIRRNLIERLSFEAEDETFEPYMAKYREMGGIVEEYLEGDKASPSVQARIDPTGGHQIVSSHDQILGGRTGQVFLGSTFPAHPDYRGQIHDVADSVATELSRAGVIGRFSVDFVSVRGEEGWKHYALEMNLRKGGTTLPYLMLKFLTGGAYDANTGIYTTPTGQARYYHASDNVEKEQYRGLTPDDLIDIVVQNELHFRSHRQQGVVFHLIGALSEFGKLGVVGIGHSPERATQLYRETVDVLDRETGDDIHIDLRDKTAALTPSER